MLIAGAAFKVIAGLANAVTVIRGLATGSSLAWSAGSKLFSILGRGAGIAGKFGEVFEAASRLAGPLGIVAAVLGTIADDVAEFKKFQQHPPNLWDTFREGLGPLGAMLPRDLPHGAQAQTARASKHGGASGSWRTGPTTTVHQTVHVSVNLPKGSDSGYARRILQLVKSLAGGLHTSSLYDIQTGSYGGGGHGWG